MNYFEIFKSYSEFFQFYCPNVKCQAMVPCEIDVGLGVCGVCNFNFCTNCLKPYHGESEFSPYRKYADDYETQTNHSADKGQNRNEAKKIEIRIFILNNCF
jgi:hypothetical protein